MHQLLNEPMNDSERECLEPIMSNGEVELEYDVPAFQDRVIGMAVDPLHMNDTNDHAELDMKCVCDALCELEGGLGEFKTLRLTQDAHELSCMPDNEQSKAVCRRHAKHHN